MKLSLIEVNAAALYRILSSIFTVDRPRVSRSLFGISPPISAVTRWRADHCA
jgi:hypothetical protein